MRVTVAPFVPMKQAPRIGSPVASPGSVVYRPWPPNVARGFVQPGHVAPVLATIQTAFPGDSPSFTFPYICPFQTPNWA